MRLRRDHGPRAGMVNSVSSSIRERQADPLATRPPPSHTLVTPEASLYVAVIHLSPSFPVSLPASLSRLVCALPLLAKLHRYWNYQIEHILARTHALPALPLSWINAPLKRQYIFMRTCAFSFPFFFFNKRKR